MSSSNFRKDIVSGDWILIAPSIKKKPNFFGKSSKRPNAPQGSCPFEDPQKAGHGKPIYWLSKAGAVEKDPASWFVQAIPNKFPVLTEQKACPVVLSEGPYKTMKGVGFQEIVITRDHERSLGFMNNDEISLVVKTYIERYKALKKEKCVEYILIFHNNGPTAGASVGHPHSQIFALPIVPTDVSRSLAGSEKYFSKQAELRGKKRFFWYSKNEKDYLLIQAPIKFGHKNITGLIQIALDLSYQHAVIHDHRILIIALFVFIIFVDIILTDCDGLSLVVFNHHIVR